MESISYTTLKIKPKTAKDFRKFSRSLGKQQTETLQLMLNFFRNNGLSPFDELGPNFNILEKRIKARINAVVAIIRDIEKTQTKPTLSMLQLLFQENPAKKEIMREKNRPSEARDNFTEIRLREKNAVLQKRIFQSRELASGILNRVAISRSSFGKVQLRLMMTLEEFEEVKNQHKNL